MLNHILRRTIYFALIVCFFVPTGSYILMSFLYFSRNSLVSAVPVILLLFTFAVAYLDAYWSLRSPTDRFEFFGIIQDRHVFWFEINALFYFLTLIDLFIATIFLGVDISVLPAQVESTGFDVTTAVLVFIVIYVLAVFYRNSVANLLGQGYGRAIEGGKGKLAGSSIIGVAAFADLALVQMEKKQLRGIGHLRDAMRELNEVLLARRIESKSLEEGVAKVTFVASYNAEPPYDELKELGNKLRGLSERTPTPADFAGIGGAVEVFSKRIQWPDTLTVVKTKSSSVYNTIGAAGTVVSAIAAFISLVLYFVLPPGTLQLGPASVTLEGVALVLTAVILAGFVVYRPLSRLENTSIGWIEWKAIRDARAVYPKRPGVPYALSVFGGVMVTVAGTLATLATYATGLPVAGLGMAYGMLGTLSGVLMIFGGLMLHRNPKRHKAWGLLIVVCSFLSLFGALGGFLFGFFTGLIGGGLAIRWRVRDDGDREARAR